jgi:hypothetical protein
MVNKDFLRQILMEEKQLLPMSAVKSVNVPAYDELSVRNLWGSCQQSPELMLYFPDKLPVGRLPDRKYMFDVMNTLNPDYVL